ncbi:aminopeptidase N [Euzebya tangerina]|uniref:aminopeptidase N n=1 Tax=Euzebya tangerina TaxID=591198 RepID=UPI000E31A4D1|nr:aminopeptidase N [Euzebya tangerina]
MTTSNLTREAAVRRASLVGQVSYDVDLDVAGPDDETFGSTTRITWTTPDPGEGVFVDLAAHTVDRVVLNGRELRDVYRDGRIHLDDLTERNELVVEARCEYSRSGVGLHRFTDPVDDQVFLYTQFEPFEAHRVFACFDQPDLKAPFRLAVTAPTGWQVVSNAAVASGSPDTGVWAFEPTPPISTYITAMVAGPYHKVEATHGDVAMGIYCRTSLAEFLDPDEIFEITTQGLDWFAEAFDVPYPFGKYDQLFVPEFNFGAMENPGCVTFTESYLFRSRVTDATRLQRANTILHEMAHMWFGDLVTMRWWDDLWLNESFATFIAHTAVGEATRFGDDSWSDFAHSMKAWAYQQDQLPSTHPIVADMVDTESVMANFDGITYAKGASVLKQLHAWVGEDAFISGLRDYFDAHAWGNATLRDFLSALEGPSGRDLLPWAKQWLQTAGVATLSAEVETDDSDVITAASIIQQAPVKHPTLRPHRLRVGLYNNGPDGLTRTQLIEGDIDGATTSFPGLVGKPRPDLLLVNDDDLAYAKVRLDERSISTLEESLGTLAGGVARAVCWGSLWDMTRDGELAARRFAELIARHSVAESDIGVLQTLVRQMTACADRYGAPINRETLRGRLTNLAHEQLESAEPGSDEQLVWVRAICSSRMDYPFIRGLLDGGLVVEGLAVDPDLRWFALGHLSAMGHADAERIQQELERDPTDVGRRGAEASRAARPLGEAKAEAWERALDTSLALHSRRAILRGFWQVEQAEVLRGYATTRWLEALPSLWADRSGEEALSMTEQLYPHSFIDEIVVEAADRAMALDLPPVAKRRVAESQDSTRRALRAQQTDASAT